MLESMKFIDAVDKYPDGFTINWMNERPNRKGEDLIEFTFKENPKICVNGKAKLLFELWEAWTSDFGGSITDLQEYLRAHPTRVKVKKRQKMDGNGWYYCFQVMDDETDGGCDEELPKTRDATDEASADLHGH